jgi:bifunctional DNase/RNase
MRFKVHGVLADTNSEAQIVILRDEKNLEILPIWVGLSEGNAIRFALEGILPPRPMTHDLLRSTLDHLGVRVIKIIISEIKNNTYFATVHLDARGTEVTIDARPSDAIALALRTSAPLFVTEEVLKRKSGENLDVWLEKLNPKDFGKYDT